MKVKTLHNIYLKEKRKNILVLRGKQEIIIFSEVFQSYSIQFFHNESNKDQ